MKPGRGEQPARDQYPVEPIDPDDPDNERQNRIVTAAERIMLHAAFVAFIADEFPAR